MEKTAHVRALLKYGLGTADDGDGYRGFFYSFCRTAGSRIAVHGIAGLVESVRIGGNRIVRGATSVLMQSVYPVMDVEVSQIYMIRGRGMRCSQLRSTTCLSRPRCRHTAILVDQPGP